MPSAPTTKPVEDSVPKIGDVAVGEDMDFQRRWWRFEDIVWSIFLVILVCDLLGLFGRGWLAKAKQSTPDQALTLDYERIERASTPSIMTFHFAPSAIHDGHIQLFVSDTIVKQLGAQRVSPQPAVSALSPQGITYTFAATAGPDVVEIALEPSFPGLHTFRVQLLGSSGGNADSDAINAKVFVVP
jgi:hypothetical protein